MGVMRPELVMKSIVPVVMAGVLGIYGLIIAVIISTGSASSMPSIQSRWILSGHMLCKAVAGKSYSQCEHHHVALDLYICHCLLCKECCFASKVSDCLTNHILHEA